MWNYSKKLVHQNKKRILKTYLLDVFMHIQMMLKPRMYENNEIHIHNAI